MEVNRNSSLEEQIQDILHILEDQSICKDIITTYGNVFYVCTETYKICDNEYEFIPYAEIQLFNKLGIPSTYMEKCPFSLRDVNVNYWLNYHKDKKVMFRLSDKNTVRAVLTDRYIKQDNNSIIPKFLSTIKQYPDKFRVLKMDKNEEFMELYITFHDVIYNVNNALYNPGIVLCNSEIGLSKLKILPFVAIRKDNKLYTHLFDQVLFSVKHSFSGEIDFEPIIEKVSEWQFANDKFIQELFKCKNISSSDFIKELHLSPLFYKELLNELPNKKEITVEEFIIDLLDRIENISLYKQHLMKLELSRVIGALLG